MGFGCGEFRNGCHNSYLKDIVIDLTPEDCAIYKDQPGPWSIDYQFCKVNKAISDPLNHDQQEVSFL